MTVKQRYKSIKSVVQIFIQAQWSSLIELKSSKNKLHLCSFRILFKSKCIGEIRLPMYCRKLFLLLLSFTKSLKAGESKVERFLQKCVLP